MPNLYSNTNDGWISSNTQSSWAAARDAVSGGTPDTNDLYTTYPVSVSRFGGRGGGNTYRVIRSFMYFDTSGITGTVSAATIKIRGYNLTSGSIIAVKSTAFGGDGGTALAAGDIDAIVGWTTGASAEGNVTKYSSPALGAGLSTTWSTSGYNDLASTSDLRSDMKNNNVVIVCFMDYTNDFRNTALTSNVSLSTGLWWTDYSGTSNDPHIEYTIAAGYANNVNGVAAASISKINGVATASIEKVNGI